MPDRTQLLNDGAGQSAPSKTLAECGPPSWDDVPAIDAKFAEKELKRIAENQHARLMGGNGVPYYLELDGYFDLIDLREMLALLERIR